jgi:hypothetical protein
MTQEHLTAAINLIATEAMRSYRTRKLATTVIGAGIEIALGLQPAKGHKRAAKVAATNGSMIEKLKVLGMAIMYHNDTDNPGAQMMLTEKINEWFANQPEEIEK